MEQLDSDRDNTPTLDGRLLVDALGLDPQGIYTQEEIDAVLQSARMAVGEHVDVLKTDTTTG